MITLSFEELTAQAMALPDDRKFELIDRLTADLTTEDEGDNISPEEQAAIDAAWAEEIERRIDLIERGEMKLIPAEEVYRQQEARRKS